MADTEGELAAPNEGLTDTELEWVSEITGVAEAKREAEPEEATVTVGAAVVVKSAVLLAVEDAVGATVPDRSREPLVKGVEDLVLSALRVLGAVADTEGEGDWEGDTVGDTDARAEFVWVGDSESVGDTVRVAGALEGDMDGEADKLALGVREAALEGEGDCDADKEGEPEAVVGDEEAVRLRVAAPVREPPEDREASNEPVIVGDSVASKLSLESAVPVGSAVHEGEPEGDAEPPSTVPLGESEAVTDADSEGVWVCVVDVVAVSIAVSEPSAVEETLAVLLTVSVGAALPVATGVPLRCEPDTRGEPEARSVKDCVMVGEEVVDTDREKVLPAEALLENVSDCETDALPVTESVWVLAWEGDASSEGDADAEAQARVDDDALLEGSWEKVAVMHTLTETQPEGVEEGDEVRVTGGERVAVGEKVPRAVPVATSEADKPGEND